jgi:hypothetical protein
MDILNYESGDVVIRDEGQETRLAREALHLKHARLLNPSARSELARHDHALHQHADLSWRATPRRS